MVKTKKCAYCKVEKPVSTEAFSKYSYSADGFNSRCKDCEKARRNGVLKRPAAMEHKKAAEVALYRTVHALADTIRFVVKPLFHQQEHTATHLTFTSVQGEDFEVILLPAVKHD